MLLGAYNPQITRISADYTTHCPFHPKDVLGKNLSISDWAQRDRRGRGEDGFLVELWHKLS